MTISFGLRSIADPTRRSVHRRPQARRPRRRASSPSRRSRSCAPGYLAYLRHILPVIARHQQQPSAYEYLRDSIEGGPTRASSPRGCAARASPASPCNLRGRHGAPPRAQARGPRVRLRQAQALREPSRQSRRLTGARRTRQDRDRNRMTANPGAPTARRRGASPRPSGCDRFFASGEQRGAASIGRASGSSSSRCWGRLRGRARRHDDHYLPRRAASACARAHAPGPSSGRGRRTRWSGRRLSRSPPRLPLPRRRHGRGDAQARGAERPPRVGTRSRSSRATCCFAREQAAGEPGRGRAAPAGRHLRGCASAS